MTQRVKPLRFPIFRAITVLPALIVVLDDNQLWAEFVKPDHSWLPMKLVQLRNLMGDSGESKIICLHRLFSPKYGW